MSAECSGINYALRFREKVIEARARPFQGTTMTMQMNRIKSIEMLRKSVMPPALIGAVCLSSGLVLGLVEEESLAAVPLVLRSPLQYLSIGAAAICLAILLSRWFFVNLVLKPVDGSSITVRMVPTGSAKRFVVLIQGETRTVEAA
jgi:hypothetical protein